QYCEYWTAHVGIEVYRIDDLNVWPARELGERRADALKPAAKALATMSRDEDQTTTRIEKAEVVCQLCTQLVFGVQPLRDVHDGVDCGIAGHMDMVGCDSFTQQILLGPFGRREMDGGDHGGEAAIQFLRPRCHQVGCPQSGFHMRNRCSPVERGQACCK